MTRKKFVKQLMQLEGYSRNRANRLAELTRLAGCPYEERLVLWGVPRVFDAVRLLHTQSLLEMMGGVRKVRPMTSKRKHDGLHVHLALVDEWDSLPSDKLHEQAVQACAGGGEQ